MYLEISVKLNAKVEWGHLGITLKDEKNAQNIDNTSGNEKSFSLYL